MTPLLDLSLLCSCVFLGSLTSGAGIIPTLHSRKSLAFVILSPFYLEFKAPSHPPLVAFTSQEIPLQQTLSGLLLVFPEVSKLYHRVSAQHHFGTLRSRSELFSVLTFPWYSQTAGEGRAQSRMQRSLSHSTVTRGFQSPPLILSEANTLEEEGQWHL